MTRGDHHLRLVTRATCGHRHTTGGTTWVCVKAPHDSGHHLYRAVPA